MSSLAFKNTTPGTIWDFEQSSGVSDYAQQISKSLESIRSDVKEDNVSFGFSFKEALSGLNEIALDASKENWDGYGAKKIDKGSYYGAKRFINALPLGVEMPEVSVHPDGEVAFDWYVKKGFMLSVSISPEEEIAYAYRFGLRKNYGKEYYADTIPETILEKIKELTSK